ncbi:hypothetical protein F511_28254 [Dorcoceras hygrometricum]|uniref:Sec1 family domain-containing protein MIP3 n=1 Tax=Dorcoceras hygrometricum TaxID=472368 RepID=A0A2Z7B8R6_9LAMI|nr:hypothetical protein F511_28254 [Dorcoceras hygrometricum]
MASVDVIKCCLDSIRQISDNIKDAIVFLDAGSAESYQFLGAFPLFFELGAVSVCSLENVSSLDKAVGWSTNSDPVKKVVVITSRLLSDVHRYIKRCLSTLQNARKCTIYTSISEVSHSAYPDSPLGPDAFHEYESLLVQDYEEVVKKHETESYVTGKHNHKESTASQDEGWSQLTSLESDTTGFHDISSTNIPQQDSSDDVSEKLIVSVHHFPLILCAFSPRVFVLPSEGSVAESFLSSEHENSVSSGLPPLSTGKPSYAEDVSPGATLTAQFIYHLALKMDLKLEIFSLGDLLLTDMSSLYDVGRRKRSAGLLLIDRTLDLLTPCCHGDSLVDRMFSSLPRRERKTSLTRTKGSLSHLQNVPVKVERAPLDVQIPLEKIINENESNSKFQLLESIEAFLHGWNIGDSDAQTVDLMKLSRKLNDKSDLLHGSFISTENFRGAPYLEAILDRRTKDGAMLIKKWLQESLRRENISLDMRIRSGFATKSELQALAKALAKRQSCLVKNKGIIQIAAAALNALDVVNSAYWDAFNSAEKILHVNAADTIQSLAAQISDLINKTALDGSQLQNRDNMEKPKGLITLPDALLLTVIGYLLAGENFPTSGSDGPFSWQEEHFMKEAIVDAILENPVIPKLKFLQGLSKELEANLNKTKFDEKKERSSTQLDSVDFDDDQWDSWGEDDNDAEKDAGTEPAYGDMQLKLEIRDRVDNLFKFLHKLSSMWTNSPLKELMLALQSKRNDDTHPAKGLLRKIVTSALEKNEIPGLEYHSSTVGRLFKSGFGRFGLGQAKPSLAEQNVILIFVIGGINAVEVREVQEALTESSRPDIELVLGGTTFLTPNNMCELLLGDYSYI